MMPLGLVMCFTPINLNLRWRNKIVKIKTITVIKALEKTRSTNINTNKIETRKNPN